MGALFTSTSNLLLEPLKRNSEALEGIQRTYYQTGSGLKTVYVYEMAPVILGGPLRREVSGST